MLEILINKNEDKKEIVLLENGKVVEYYIDEDNSRRKEGNIYTGIVRNIVYEDIQDISQEQTTKQIVTVEVLDPVTAEYNLEFCEGESAEYRGTTYTAAGTYEVLAEGEVRDTIITVNVVIYNDEVVHMDPRTVAAGDVVEMPDGEWFLGETAVSGSYQTSEADVENGLEFVQYGKTENECEKTTILAVTVTSREAIENIFVDENVEKVFRDGVLYIRRGDKLFNASGKRVE